MAFDLNLTATVQLGPGTVRNLQQQLNSGLRGQTVNVNVRLNPQATAQIARLNSQLNSIGVSAANLSGASQRASASLGIIGQSASRSSGQLAQAGSALRAYGVIATQSAGQIGHAGDAVEAFGRQAGLAARRFLAFNLAAGSITRLVSSFRDALSEAIKFDREMIRLLQVSDESATKVRGVADEVTRLATTFGVSSKSLLDVAVIFKQAGLSIDETKTALEAMAKAANAPNFDTLKDTAEGAIAVMRQFKVDAQGLEGALGSVNAVAGDFAAEAKDLITVIKATGGAFRASSNDFKSGQENLNELLALFTAVRSTTRESAETISTGLRTIFTRLQRKDTVDALKDLNINLRRTKEEAFELGNVNLEGQFVGAYEAVKRLSEGLSKLSNTDPRFAAVIEQLGGYRQISKTIPLIQQFGEAQKAYNVAQAGSISLAVANEKAQEAFAIKLTRTKEEFLGFVRAVTQTSGFKVLLDQLTGIGKALAQTGDFLKPLIPLLVTFAGVKIGQGLRSLFTGVRTGVTTRSASPHLASGGQVLGFSSGGVVPGYGDSDSVPAMLTPQEVVLPKRHPLAQAIRKKPSFFRRKGMEFATSIGFMMGGGVATDDDAMEYLARGQSQAAVQSTVDGRPRTGLPVRRYTKGGLTGPLGRLPYRIRRPFTGEPVEHFDDNADYSTFLHNFDAEHDYRRGTPERRAAQRYQRYLNRTENHAAYLRGDIIQLAQVLGVRPAMQQERILTRSSADRRILEKIGYNRPEAATRIAQLVGATDNDRIDSYSVTGYNGYLEFFTQLNGDRNFPATSIEIAKNTKRSRSISAVASVDRKQAENYPLEQYVRQLLYGANTSFSAFSVPGKILQDRFGVVPVDSRSNTYKPGLRNITSLLKLRFALLDKVSGLRRFANGGELPHLSLFGARPRFRRPFRGEPLDAHFGGQDLDFENAFKSVHDPVHNPDDESTFAAAVARSSASSRDKYRALRYANYLKATENSLPYVHGDILSLYDLIPRKFTSRQIDTEGFSDERIQRYFTRRLFRGDFGIQRLRAGLGLADTDNLRVVDHPNLPDTYNAKVARKNGSVLDFSFLTNGKRIEPRQFISNFSDIHPDILFRQLTSGMLTAPPRYALVGGNLTDISKSAFEKFGANFELASGSFDSFFGGVPKNDRTAHKLQELRPELFENGSIFSVLPGAFSINPRDKLTALKLREFLRGVVANGRKFATGGVADYSHLLPNLTKKFGARGLSEFNAEGLVRHLLLGNTGRKGVAEFDPTASALFINTAATKDFGGLLPLAAHELTHAASRKSALLSGLDFAGHAPLANMVPGNPFAKAGLFLRDNNFLRRAIGSDGYNDYAKQFHGLVSQPFDLDDEALATALEFHVRKQITGNSPLTPELQKIAVQAATSVLPEISRVSRTGLAPSPRSPYALSQLINSFRLQKHATGGIVDYSHALPGLSKALKLRGFPQFRAQGLVKSLLIGNNPKGYAGLFGSDESAIYLNPAKKGISGGVLPLAAHELTHAANFKYGYLSPHNFPTGFSPLGNRVPNTMFEKAGIFLRQNDFLRRAIGSYNYSFYANHYGKEKDFQGAIDDEAIATALENHVRGRVTGKTKLDPAVQRVADEAAKRLLPSISRISRGIAPTQFSSLDSFLHSIEPAHFAVGGEAKLRLRDTFEYLKRKGLPLPNLSDRERAYRYTDSDRAFRRKALSGRVVGLRNRLIEESLLAGILPAQNAQVQLKDRQTRNTLRQANLTGLAVRNLLGVSDEDFVHLTDISRSGSPLFRAIIASPGSNAGVTATLGFEQDYRTKQIYLNRPSVTFDTREHDLIPDSNILRSLLYGRPSKLTNSLSFSDIIAPTIPGRGNRVSFSVAERIMRRLGVDTPTRNQEFDPFYQMVGLNVESYKRPSIGTLLRKGVEGNNPDILKRRKTYSAEVRRFLENNDLGFHSFIVDPTNEKVLRSLISTATHIGLGRTRRFAKGGVAIVPGTGNTDSVPTVLPAGSFVLRKSVTQKLLRNKYAEGGNVPAMVMPGEAIFDPDTVKRIGLSKLHRLNDFGKYASGGVVKMATGGDTVSYHEFRANAGLLTTGNNLSSVTTSINAALNGLKEAIQKQIQAINPHISAQQAATQAEKEFIRLRTQEAAAVRAELAAEKLMAEAAAKRGTALHDVAATEARAKQLNRQAARLEASAQQKSQDPFLQAQAQQEAARAERLRQRADNAVAGAQRRSNQLNSKANREEAQAALLLQKRDSIRNAPENQVRIVTDALGRETADLAHLHNQPTIVRTGRDTLAGLALANTESEVNRRGGKASEFTRATILQQEENRLHESYILAVRNQILSLNKSLSIEEAKRIAEQHYAQALQTGEAITVRKEGRNFGNFFGLFGRRDTAAGDDNLRQELEAQGKNGAGLGFFGRVGRRIVSLRRGLTPPQNAFLLQNALFTGAPLLGSAIEGFGPVNAESAVLSGNTDSFARTRQASGSLFGAAQGAAIGAAFGFTGIGAGVGALVGFISSLETAAKEIREAKIAKAINEVSLSLENLNKGLITLDTNVGKNIIDQQKEAFNTLSEQAAKDASTTFLGLSLFGPNSKEFAANVRRGELTTFGPQIPQLTSLLNKQAETIGKQTFSKPISFKDFSKEFLAANGGFNRTQLQNLARIQQVSPDTLLRNFFKVTQEVGRSERAQRAEQEARQGATTGANSLESLTTGVQAATVSLERLTERAKLLGDVFDNNITASRIHSPADVLNIEGNPNRSQFRSALNAVSSPLGEGGVQLSNVGNALRDVGEVLPIVLAQVRSRPKLEGREIGAEIRDGLKKALGVPDQTHGILTGGAAFGAENREITRLINLVSGQIHTDNFDKILAEAGQDVSRASKKLIEPLQGPYQDAVNKLSRGLEQAANTFIDGMTAFVQRQQRLGQEQDHANELVLNAQREEARVHAHSVGRESDTLDFLPVSTLTRPFIERQNRLAPGAGLDPNAITKRLIEVNGQIGEAQQAQQRAFENGGGDAFTSAAKKLADLKGEASNLTTALRHLADASQLNAVYQEKLAKLNVDRDARRSLAERVATGGPDEIARLSRGVLLAQQAKDQNFDIGNFGESDRKVLFDFLNAVRNVKLSGFGGINGEDFKNNVLDKLLGGSFQEDKESKGQRSSLEQLIKQNNERAIAAQQGIILQQSHLQSEFFSRLGTAQEKFLIDLKAFEGQRRLIEARNQVSVQARNLDELQSKNKQKGILAQVGVTNTAQLNALEDAKGDISKIFTIGRELARANKALETSHKEAGDIINSAFDNANGSHEVLQANIAQSLQNRGFGVEESRIIKDRLETLTQSRPGAERTRANYTTDLQRILSDIAPEFRGNFERQIQDVQTHAGGFQRLNAVGPDIVGKVVGAATRQDNPLLTESSIFDAVRIIKSSSTSLEDLALQTDRATKALREFSDLALNMSGRKAYGEAVGGAAFAFATGGSVFKPRGTDTVPAMLSPGEFVVNAKSARANGGLLDRINNASGPVYMAGGGFYANPYANFIEDGGTEFRRQSIFPGPVDIGEDINIPVSDFEKFRRSRAKRNAIQGNSEFEEFRKERQRVSGGPAELEAIRRRRLNSGANFANPYGGFVEQEQSEFDRFRGTRTGLVLSGSPEPPDLLNLPRRRRRRIGANGIRAGLGIGGVVGARLGINDPLARFAALNPGGPAALEIARRNGARPQDLARISQQGEVLNFGAQGLANTGLQRPGASEQNQIIGDAFAARQAQVAQAARNNNLIQQGLRKQVQPQQVPLAQQGAGAAAGAVFGGAAFAGAGGIAGLVEPMKGFVQNIPNLQAAFGQFNTSVDKIADAISKFPSSVKLDGQTKIEVVINGAEAFSKIQPELEKFVRAKIEEAFKNKLPDLT